MQALLNIKEYFIDEISIKTNPDYQKKELDSGNVKVEFDIRRNNSNPLEFMIPLTIFLNNEEADFCAAEYCVVMKLTGFFEFTAETDEETINRMIGPSGLSILYGVARGIIAQTTGNCWHGKFILPSLNFIEILKDKAEQLAKIATQPKKRAKSA